MRETPTRLGQLPDWWMEARCECWITWIPMGMLIDEYGADASPMALASRLRCTHTCGQRPSCVAIVEDPARSCASDRSPLACQRIQLIGVDPGPHNVYGPGQRSPERPKYPPFRGGRGHQRRP